MLKFFVHLNLYNISEQLWPCPGGQLNKPLQRQEKKHLKIYVCWSCLLQIIA